MTPTSRNIDDVWREYKSAPTVELRNVLVERYLRHVKRLAGLMSSRMPKEIDLDDLVSAGVFGLMSAIDAFDPKRGFKFETYSTSRIRGAILDSVRDRDWVPRLARSRQSMLDKANHHFLSIKGRKPTENELKDYLRLDDRQFELFIAGASIPETKSLSHKFGESDSGRNWLASDELVDDSQPDPSARAEVSDAFRDCLGGAYLTRADRLLLDLYYIRDMTMREIGVALGRSESRVSQMHTEAIARIRAAIERRREAA